jgi:Asp-tRNA(Asn)/Glu-tRNA(Gln) amidotransferase C subunit
MLENDETLELTEVETKRFTESFSNIQQMFDGIN